MYKTKFLILVTVVFLVIVLKFKSRLSKAWLSAAIIAVILDFPYHHATMLSSSGREYYPDSYLTRLGLYMTIGLFVFLFGLYIPWWKLLGLL